MTLDLQNAGQIDRNSLFHPFTSVADHLRDACSAESDEPDDQAEGGVHDVEMYGQKRAVEQADVAGVRHGAHRTVSLWGREDPQAVRRCDRNGPRTHAHVIGCRSQR